MVNEAIEFIMLYIISVIVYKHYHNCSCDFHYNLNCICHRATYNNEQFQDALKEKNERHQN